MAEIRLEAILDTVIERKASDLHLYAGMVPVLRIYGELTPQMEYGVISDEAMEAILYTILSDEQKKTLIEDREVNMSFEFGDVGRFRVNAFYARGHLSASLRLITNNILSAEELGLPDVINKFTEYPNGLVLVTGPTGSGKSTSLAAMIHKINTQRSERIVTIERPIEYIHESKKSTIIQREVGSDTLSFASGIHGTLRQDQDVILLGEISDLETISGATTAAETGQLVFSTLHTNSASQTIDRLIDVFPAHQQAQIRSQLSYSMRAIMSQRLLPAAGGGRVVATEILVITPAIANIIRENKIHQIDSIIQTGASQDMHSLNQDLARLIKEGIVVYDQAARISPDLDDLGRLLRGGDS